MASVSYTDRTVTQTMRTNLVFNAQLDADTTHWSATVGGTAATAALSRAGSLASVAGQTVPYAYAAITAGTALTYVDTRVARDGIAALTAATIYTLSAYVNPTMASGTPQITMFIQWYNAGGTLISTSSTSAAAVPAGSWSRVSMTATAPAAAVSAILIFRASAATGAVSVGDVLRSTAVLLEDAPAADTYFCGSTPDAGNYTYDYAGPLNNSISIQTLTVQTGTLPDAQPAIRVSFTQADLSPSVQSITLYRIADGQTTEVRTAISLFAVGGVTVFDAEAPFGIPITYRAMQFDSAGNQLGYAPSVDAELYAPDPMIAWLSDPLDETSAFKIIMTNTAGTAPVRTIPGTVYQVGTDAHVLAGVQGRITGLDMGFYTASADDDELVLALLKQTNGSVLIRTGPQFGILIPRALYCFAGAASPTYLGGDGAVWANQVSETSPTLQPIAQSNASWDDVIAAFPTWDDVIAAFPTWLDLEKAFDTQ